MALRFVPLRGTAASTIGPLPIREEELERFRQVSGGLSGARVAEKAGTSRWKQRQAANPLQMGQSPEKPGAYIRYHDDYGVGRPSTRDEVLFEIAVLEYLVSGGAFLGVHPE